MGLWELEKLKYANNLAGYLIKMYILMVIGAGT
jgi:hypothetical protein